MLWFIACAYAVVLAPVALARAQSSSTEPVPAEPPPAFVAEPDAVEPAPATEPPAATPPTQPSSSSATTEPSVTAEVNEPDDGAGSEGLRGTIVIVRQKDDDRVVIRLRAELEASAWRVVEIGPDEKLRLIELEDLAKTHTARAAIRVHSSRSKIDLWIEAPPGTTGGFTETLSSRGSKNEDKVLALRTTEALRARGLKIDRGLESREPPKPEQAVLPADTRQEIAISSPPYSAYGLWFELAPAVTFSSGGLGPGLGTWLSLRLQPARFWSIGAFGLLPIWREPVQQPEGSASISTLMAGMTAHLHLTWKRWELNLVIGLAGTYTRMSGEAREPFSDDEDSVTTAAAFAGPWLNLYLGDGFRLGVKTTVGTALPRVAVHFVERNVAHWGRPFVVCALGLELPLFGWGPPRSI